MRNGMLRDAAAYDNLLVNIVCGHFVAIQNERKQYILNKNKSILIFSM